MADLDLDYIDKFSSLDNLMAYGLGKQAPANLPATTPVAGVAGPYVDDQYLYNAFPDSPPQTQTPVANGLMGDVFNTMMPGKRSDVEGTGILSERPTTPYQKGPILGPGVLPKTIPADVSMTPPSYNAPEGNSMGQVDILREALKRVESGGKANPYLAKNPSTSASGAWQWVNKTWNNYGGYKEARFAPREVQEARINEDLVQSLRQFKGDPFAIIANHMLPKQARQPWLWTQPSRLQVKNKQGQRVWVTIPPVYDYVAKVVKGTPYENELKKYMAAYVPR